MAIYQAAHGAAHQGGAHAAAQPGDHLNRILAALPRDVWLRLAPDVTLVDMPLGHVIHESGGKLDHIYFPATSIISLLYVMESGASAQVAIVGNEGVVGVALFLGGNSMPSTAIVQNTGQAYRLNAQALKDEFNHSGALRHLLLCYTQALITQIAQTAACNRHHAVDQQLCRWLLLSLDRLPTNILHTTQELIANMLGVRRSSVTEAALKLQEAGLIRYHRGQIEILDRPGLERRVCECYGVVRAEFNRLYKN